MNITEVFHPNEKYFQYFKDLIKCYKAHCKYHTEKTIEDVVFFLDDKEYRHQFIVSENGQNYIVSSDMQFLSGGYDRIIPLVNKIPYFPGYLVEKDKMYGLLNLQFKEIVPCRYAWLRPNCFEETVEGDNNKVTHAVITLFEALDWDGERSIISLEGENLFDGYDFIYPFTSEKEYRYDFVDYTYYCTSCERWTSFFIDSDVERRAAENLDFLAYDRCAYKVQEVEEGYQLSRIEPDVSEKDSTLPPEILLIRKYSDFLIDDTYFAATVQQAEDFLGQSLKEYLLRLNCKNLHVDMPLSALDPSVRVYNILRRGKIDTIADFCSAERDYLLSLPGMGIKAKEELLLMRKVLLEVFSSGNGSGKTSC